MARRFIYAALILMIVGVLLVTPAAASNQFHKPVLELADVDPVVIEGSTIDYDASADGYLIGRIIIRAPYPRNVTIIVTDLAGQTHQGGVSRYPLDLSHDNHTRWFGTNVSGGSTFVLGAGIQLGDPNRYTCKYYIDYWIPSIYSDGHDSGARFVGITEQSGGDGSLPLCPIYRGIYSVSIRSDCPVQVEIYAVEPSVVEAGISKTETSVTGFVSFVQEATGTLYFLVTVSWTVFTQYILGNGLLILGLYEALAMALSVNRAQNIFDALSQFIQYNVKLADFVVWAIDSILKIVWRIINSIPFI